MKKGIKSASFILFKLCFSFFFFFFLLPGSRSQYISILLPLAADPKHFQHCRKLCERELSYLGKELIDLWVLPVQKLVAFVHSCSAQMPNELFLLETAKRILSLTGFGKPPNWSCRCSEEDEEEGGELTLSLYLKVNKIKPNKL